MELTQALLSLTKAAESRRISRKSLREATEMIANQIVENARRGDEIAVDGHTFEVRRLQCYGSQGGGWPLCHWFADSNDLIMDGSSIISEPQTSEQIDSNLVYVRNGGGYMLTKPGYDEDMRGGDYNCFVAGPETRQKFAELASKVIAAFAELYAKQAEAAKAATDSIARLAAK
jgi:hypothetical protein